MAIRTLNHATEASGLRAGLRSAAFVGHSAHTLFEARGADTLDLLHRLSTNDLKDTRVGSAAATVFTTEKGRVIDYATACIGSDKVILIPSGGNSGHLRAWIEKFIVMEDVQLVDQTEKAAMFSIIGPDSGAVIADLLKVVLGPSTFSRVGPDGEGTTIVSTMDFNTRMHRVILPRTSGADLLTALRLRIPEMDAATYEAYRVSRGIPGAGAELCDDFNPLECGLLHAISFTKGCYIGQEVIARLDTYGKVRRKLVGVMSDFRLPSVATRKLSLHQDSVEVGLLTSAAETPVEGKYLGLAVVRKEVPSGSLLQVRSAGEAVPMRVTNLPMALGHVA